MTLTSESWKGKGKQVANEPYIAQHRICATADGVIVDCDAPEAATMVAGAGQVVPQAVVDRFKLAKGKAVKRSRNKAVAAPADDKSDDDGDGDDEETEGDEDATEGDKDAAE